MTLALRVLHAAHAAGEEALVRLDQRGDFTLAGEVLAGAREIVDGVRKGGDAALLESVRRLDGFQEANAASDLRLDQTMARVQSSELDQTLCRAIERSIAAVHEFYAPQIPRSHHSEPGGIPGVRLEERILPFRRVGLYVPGGRFPYPSTVIMSAVPARLAGAEQIVVVTPPQAYRTSAALRYVCSRLGVDEVWGMGGAHAIAALAYGTESVDPVDFIAGPGNAWVTAAKRLVARDVGIDKEAGPSEVVILAAEDAPAEWVAADLLAQAEHDPQAAAVLITPCEELAHRVASAVERQLAELPTRQTAAAALEGLSCALVVEDWEQALAASERIAPEHLQLIGAAAEILEDRITRAGAVFVGPHTPTAFGDYLAGPSHVLPTGGAARFSSGLGVEDFVRRQHHAAFDAGAAATAAALAASMANEEGLVAHARSAALRGAENGPNEAAEGAERVAAEQDDSPARFVRPELRSLHEYSLHQVPFVHKLDQNEVPWDLPSRLKAEASARLLARNWAHYPDFHSERLRALLAARHEWPHEGVLVGNGSNELLGITLDAVVPPGGEVLGALPTFGLYEMFVRRAGGHTCFLPPRSDLALPFDELCAELATNPQRPLILCTPNNPTGAALTPAQVEQLAERIEAPLLLDNAYGEFSQHDYKEVLRRHRHLVLFGTFSKAWSLAGLRLGYLLADPDLVRELIKIKLPYNLGHASAVIGELVLEEPRWGERCVRLIVGLREKWRALLEGFGFEVFPSQGNFLLLRAPEMELIRLALAERGILIRKMSHYPGLQDCARLGIGDGRALRATAAALEEILGLAPRQDPSRGTGAPRVELSGETR
jgi:histidinol dehydrogenase